MTPAERQLLVTTAVLVEMLMPTGWRETRQLRTEADKVIDAGPQPDVIRILGHLLDAVRRLSSGYKDLADDHAEKARNLLIYGNETGEE